MAVSMQGLPFIGLLRALNRPQHLPLPGAVLYIRGQSAGSVQIPSRPASTPSSKALRSWLRVSAADRTPSSWSRTPRRYAAGGGQPAHAFDAGFDQIEGLSRLR